MTALDQWLTSATKGLAAESAAQVRREIGEHYETAREAAFENGETEETSHHFALEALGDAKQANCQYKKVLITSSEARLLRDMAWESRACVPVVKWTVRIGTLLVLAVAGYLFVDGHDGHDAKLARGILAGGLLMASWAALPTMALRTPIQIRLFRVIKWIGVALALIAAPWYFLGIISPLVWVESLRYSIRRKLPVERWPRQLYL